MSEYTDEFIEMAKVQGAHLLAVYGPNAAKIYEDGFNLGRKSGHRQACGQMMGAINDGLPDPPQ
jgi:hypothetical protein